MLTLLRRLWLWWYYLDKPQSKAKSSVSQHDNVLGNITDQLVSKPAVVKDDWFRKQSDLLVADFREPVIHTPWLDIKESAYEEEGPVQLGNVAAREIPNHTYILNIGAIQPTTNDPIFINNTNGAYTEDPTDYHPRVRSEDKTQELHDSYGNWKELPDGRGLQSGSKEERE